MEPSAFLYEMCIVVKHNLIFKLQVINLINNMDEYNKQKYDDFISKIKLYLSNWDKLFRTYQKIKLNIDSKCIHIWLINNPPIIN